MIFKNLFGANEVTSSVNELTEALTRSSIQKEIEILQTKEYTEEQIKATLAKRGYKDATIEAAMASSANATANTGEAAAEGASAAATNADTVAKNANTAAIYANIKAMLKWLVTTPQGWATLAVGAAAATVAVIAYNNSVDGMIKKNQKLIDSNKEVYDSILEEEKTFTDNANGLNEAYENYLTATKGSEEYYNAINKIAEISPELVVGYDNEGNAILANNEVIKEQIKYYKQLAEEKRNAARTEALENLDEETENYQKLVNKKESKQNQYDEAKAKLDSYENVIRKNENGETLSESEKILLDEAITSVDSYRLTVQDLKKDLEDLSNQLLTSSTQLRTWYTSLLDPVDHELTDEEKTLRQGLIDTAIKEGFSYEQLDSVDDLFLSNGLVQKAAKEIINLDDNLSDEEYRKQAMAIYTRLANQFEMTDEAKKAFQITFGIDEESYNNAAVTRENNLDLVHDKIVENRLNLVEGNSINNWAKTLSNEDLQIVAGLTFDENTTLEGLKKLLDEAKKTVDDSVEDITKNSKSKMIDLINSMSDGFDVLDDVYTDVFDKGSFDFTKLDSKKFEEAFKGLEEEYVNFIEKVSESPDDIDACQEAFNELATAFIENKGVLDNLTEENANVATAMLRNMGIYNAEEIVMAQLAHQTELTATKKAFLAQYGYEVAEASYTEMSAFLNETEASEIVEQALAQLALEKIHLNEQKIDTASDIANVINLAKAAGASTVALGKLAKAKSILGEFAETGYKYLSDAEVKEAQALVDSIESGTFDYGYDPVSADQFRVTDYSSFAPKYTGGDKTADARTKAAEEAAKNAKDAYGDMFDFFERRVKVLEDAFGNLEAGIQNVLGADEKNTLLSAQLGILDEEVNNYTDALAMYKEQANNVLSTIEDADLREKIVNGSVSLVDLQGEENEIVKAALDAYSGWADKVAECTQKLEELKKQIRELELEKFNNIIKDFTDQFDLHGTAIDNIDKQIGLLEEAGELIGDSYYTKQIEQSEKQLVLLEKQKLAMVEQLNDSLSSGRIQQGTDEWLEMVKALEEVEGNILDCKTSIEEFNNALLEIQWIVFERIQTEFGNLNSEMENLAGLFNDFNDIEVSDGKGTWTKEAIATLGLYAQQYELARYQANQYGEAIEKLKEDYIAGKYSATEYMDKLAELSQGQWDAINSAESLEDAIISLNETRVNEEIEAYRELIDAQIELIEETDKLKKKQDELAEKSKTVTDIEEQLAAMMYDNSAATVAKRKQLEAELADAKKDLSDTEYEYSKEAQIDALNKQFEDQETMLQESLKNREALLEQSFNTVKENATLVGEQIVLVAQDHGVIVSDALISAWTQGENAIAAYGQTLSAESSVFIGNIIGVENQVIGLQNEANVASVALSNMFATRADNLIWQLTNSWYAEDNLNTMTGILQNSLINTLERGYNISGITGALSGIASGMSSVESAARSAAAAIRDALGAQAESKQYYHMGASVGAGGSKWYIKDLYGNDIKYYDSYEKAEKALEEYKKKNYNYTIQKYAKGGIVSKKYNGMFDPIAESMGEDTMVAVKHGEGILTPMQTEGLLNLAPMLESFQNSLMPNHMIQNNIPVAMNNERPNVTLHYDKMFEFNGDFNNSEQLLGQMKNVASKVTAKVLNDINRDYRIHGR